MKKKLMLILSCLILSIGFITAQTTRVTGVVIDDMGEPVIGASVVVKGTTVGVATDVDGKFSINVPDGQTTLVFALVGMKTKEQTVSPNMRVAMSEDSKLLDEVVVTALGISRDAKALGFGSTTVQNSEINASKSGSVMSGLTGKVAGVNISTAGGTGTSQKVIVRGFASFTDNQPLYVVDGVPIQNTFSGNDLTNNSVDFGNSAGDINPEDVENVTVLKGASATALYGSRAANGVIMITTKKAKKNQKPILTYTGTFSASNVLRVPQTQDMFGQGWPIWDSAENGSWGPKLDGRTHEWGAPVNGVYREKPFTYIKDNLKNFYETGFEMNHNVSFSTSGENTSIAVSYGNLSSDGIVPTDADKYSRNTLSLRGSTVFDKLSLNYNVNYARKNVTAVSAGQGSDGAALFQEVIQNAIDIDLQDLKDINNPYNSVDNYYTWYAANPYWVIANNGNKYIDNHTYGNLDISYEVIPGLKAIGRLGGDFMDSRRKSWNALTHIDPNGYTHGYKSDEKGTNLERNESRNQFDATAMLDANYKISADVNLAGVLGWNYNYRDYYYTDALLSGLATEGWYNLENGYSKPTTISRKHERRLYAGFAQGEVGYKDFWYTTLSLRNDWSSTLPKDDRSFFYWGLNSSLIVTDMLPSIKNNVLNYLKVRAAYGKTGNDANWYLTTTAYEPVDILLGFGSIKYPLSGVQGLTIGNRRGNESLKPETTREAEFGFDLKLFDNRVNIDFAYYDRNTKDQIVAVTLPNETGYRSQTKNIGEISNRGIEVALGFVPVRTKDWNWNFNVTFSKNKSEVKELWNVGDTKVQEYVLRSMYGVDFVAQVGEELGVFKVPKVLTHDGKVVVNSSTGRPLIDPNEKEVVGSSAPKFLMGFVNRVSWKNLSFGMVLDWRNGGKFWSNTAEMMTWNGNAVATMYNERQPFLIPNSVKMVNGQYVENDVPIAWSGMYSYYNHSTNTAMYKNFVLSKSFLKLRELSFTYTIPQQLLSKLGFVKQMEVSAIGRNLLMWTPKENNFVDPEATNYGNDILSEVGEFTAAPTTRTFGGSVKITF